jgi:hypothetical protein
VRLITGSPLHHAGPRLYARAQPTRRHPKESSSRARMRARYRPWGRPGVMSPVPPSGHRSVPPLRLRKRSEYCTFCAMRASDYARASRLTLSQRNETRHVAAGAGLPLTPEKAELWRPRTTARSPTRSRVRRSRRHDLRSSRAIAEMRDSGHRQPPVKRAGLPPSDRVGRWSNPTGTTATSAASRTES